MAVFLLRVEHGSSYVPPACAGVFQDVECKPTPAFAVNWIEQLYHEGITGGCSASPPLYCPNDAVTRAQMAVFLLRTEHGSGYAPPTCSPPGIFADVSCPSGFAVDWIEQLYHEGITGGCSSSPLLYCPDEAATRAQMAVFLLRTEHGSGYTPPPCMGIFADVACPGGFAVDWIEQLYNEGITGGCGSVPPTPTPSPTPPPPIVVTVSDFAFSPPTVHAAVGQTVDWRWVNGFHSTTSGIPCTKNGMWDSGVIGSPNDFSVRFTSRGTYPYFCSIHCSTGMTGTVMVP